MSRQKAFRGATAILLAWGLTWAMVSCASAPPKAPEPVEAPVETVEEPPTAGVVEPVSEAAFQAARDAIAEAEAAQADLYAPDLLNEARQALTQAQEKAAADPDGARSLLKISIDKAHEAKAVAEAAALAAAEAARRQAVLDLLDKEAVEAIAEAQTAGAAQYAADLIDQARKALAQAREQGVPAFDEAQASYRTAIDKAHEARDAAREGARLAAEAALAAEEAAKKAAEAARLKALLDGLDQQAQKAIAEAEAAGAAQYASELLTQAKDALIQAQSEGMEKPTEAQASYRVAITKAHEARDAAHKAALEELDRGAQDAIAEAEAAEADQYSPALLNQARQALTQGRAKAATDPMAARGLMTTAIEKAGQARDASLKARTKALLDKLDQAMARWNALQPEKWQVEGAEALLAQGSSARAAVEADFAVGLPLATEALAALETATAQLSARLKAVQDLRLQAQKALDEAEAVDAFIWVPDLVQAANDAFFQGTGAWKKFRLDAAEEAWSTSLFQARSATAKAQAEMERKRTEQLMLETMKKLEEASGKTIVDPEDNIIAPEPWDGKKELEKLKTKPVSILIPSDGSVVVLGEKQRVTYLDEAKDQWVQGVVALEAGDLPLANEAFLQAQKLIDTYMAMAVDKIYTVKLVPNHRDSLWRIAEYDSIYSTPWEWPKIWKRNQKLIQNPDLIYPGWQLIIPPQ